MAKSKSTTKSTDKTAGDEIRQLRLAKGMTLTDLAQKIDKTAGYISQIERGLATPSIRTLQAICSALDISLSWLFDENEADTPENEKDLIVRANARRRIRYAPLKLANAQSFHDELVSPNLKGSFASGISDFDPGGAYCNTPNVIMAEVMYFILEGEIQFEIGGETFSLSEEDCLQFDATEPHIIRNASTENRARLLWCQSPVRFPYKQQED